jgi:hypothetical protein
MCEAFTNLSNTVENDKDKFAADKRNKMQSRHER